jgi:pyridoxal phosphate enzyme (YggS family)
MPPGAAIGEQLQHVRRRIDAAAQRAGREPGSVALIAVSKTFPASSVVEALATGQRAFGENRVQEALDKMGEVTALVASPSIDWHLIGHLQSNKAKKAAAHFGWIHSVDSIDLVTRLDAGAVEAGTRPRILIQVDLAGEVTKHGARADEVRRVADAAILARALDLRGLMIVPPVPVDPEDSRPWFGRLRAVRDQLLADGIPATHLSELSMGMSHDLDVAVEEGATMVRVGTAIFGGRA